MGRRRWRRAVLFGVAFAALAAWPVAARTNRQAARNAPPALVVRVAYGDSLWTLARRYGNPHRDVRAVIAEIAAANRTRAGQLQPGQELVIPLDST